MPPPTQAASPKPFGPRQWHRIGGTADAWVFPITGKPTITNSSAYVVRTPSTVVVIDPGADPDQASLVAETVLEARGERERTFLLILTHAHLDHFLNIDRVVEACGRPLSFAHAEAVAAIGRKDRNHTLAILYKDARLPDWIPDVRLFATSARSEAAVGTATAPATAAFRPTPQTDAELPHLELELDRGNTLEIYATPGHSPCSCSVRLGEFIAIGDIQFAANPGLAGLAGWSAAALKTSLQTMLRLLSRGDIAVCGHGHGDCAPADAVARALEGVQDRLGGLGGIAALDDRRVSSLRSFAVELLSESQRLFAILGGRLLYVSHLLDRLEEADEAARILSLIDIEAIEHVLSELDAFHQAFEAGKHPELAVVLKANAVVDRLRRSISSTPSLQSVCLFLLGRIEQLLGDFGQAVQGLAFDVKPETVDMLDLVRSVANREREASRNNAILLAAADDVDVFAAAMTQAIASRSLLAVTPIVVEGGQTNGIAASVDVSRFCNLLATLLELAAVGASGRPVKISVGGRAGGVDVAIRCVRDDLAGSVTPAQRLLYHRLMVGMGGAFGVTSSGFVLSIPCPS